MTTDDRLLLADLLKRPIQHWDTAFGMKRPTWCFWRWPKFRLCVAATRRAIASTLDNRNECPPCLPYVEPLATTDGVVTVIVRMWGRPVPGVGRRALPIELERVFQGSDHDD